MYFVIFKNNLQNDCNHKNEDIVTVPGKNCVVPSCSEGIVPSFRE
jgi:hypothetical protein